MRELQLPAEMIRRAAAKLGELREAVILASPDERDEWDSGVVVAVLAAAFDGARDYHGDVLDLAVDGAVVNMRRHGRDIAFAITGGRYVVGLNAREALEIGLSLIAAAYSAAAEQTPTQPGKTDQGEVDHV